MLVCVLLVGSPVFPVQAVLISLRTLPVMVFFVRSVVFLIRIHSFGALAIGALVVGALIVGALVVGALVVGALVVGAPVVGALVVGALVVGALVVGTSFGTRFRSVALSWIFLMILVLRESIPMFHDQFEVA